MDYHRIIVSCDHLSRHVRWNVSRIPRIYLTQKEFGKGRENVEGDITFKRTNHIWTASSARSRLLIGERGDHGR